MVTETISGNGTQEQATNVEEIELWAYYELDHKHISPWIGSTQFWHTRICRVTGITQAFVRVSYVSPRYLRCHFESGNPNNHPVFEGRSVIRHEVATKVLCRKVDRQEFDANKFRISFWFANPNQRQPQVRRKDLEEQRLKAESPVMESKREDKSSVSVNHVETRLRNLKFQPTSRGVEGSRRLMTPGGSHFTRKGHKNVTPEAAPIGQKVEHSSGEDLEDKNNASIIYLSDSEDDDIVVVSDKQRSQVMSSASIKRKLLPRNAGYHRNKKSNKSDSSIDEKMQEIIYGLLDVGISQSDVGKAAEFCYNDPAKAKVFFSLPSHMRRSYVLGFLHPYNHDEIDDYSPEEA